MTKSSDIEVKSDTLILSARRLDQRERLLSAAYELVEEVGIEGLRTRDITKKAGLNLAIFHYCFGSKDDLLRALYQHIMSRFRSQTDNFYLSGGGPKDRLEKLLRVRVYLTQHMARDLKVWRTFQGLAETNETVREILKEHFAAQRDRIAELLKHGAQSGELLPILSLKPDVAAALIVSLQSGMFMQLGIDPRAFDPESYAAAILSLIAGS